MKEEIIRYPNGKIKEIGRLDDDHQRQGKWGHWKEAAFVGESTWMGQHTYLDDVYHGPAVEVIGKDVYRGHYMWGKKQGLWTVTNEHVRPRKNETMLYENGAIVKKMVTKYNQRGMQQTTTTYYENGSAVAIQQGNGPIQRTLHPTQTFAPKEKAPPEIPYTLQQIRAGGLLPEKFEEIPDMECPISLDQIGSAFFKCLHPDETMVHYFDADTFVGYAKKSDKLGHMCPIDRTYEIDPQRYMKI